MPTPSLGGAFIPAASYNRTGSLDTNNELRVAKVERKVKVYPDSAAITVESHIAILTKSTASAMTITAPTRDGIEITIISGTSAAHVLTGTNLFWAGVTGGPFNKITTAAFPASGATIVSSGGLWLVTAAVVATIGD